jgi:hypothetical protein
MGEQLVTLDQARQAMHDLAKDLDILRREAGFKLEDDNPIDQAFRTAQRLFKVACREYVKAVEELEAK